MSLLVTAPVIDVDGTLFVQGVLFLVLMAILDPLLFRPWLKTRARRREAIEGADERARGLVGEAKDLARGRDERLAEAAAQAAAHASRAHRQHESRLEAEVGAARAAAARMLEDERRRLRTEVETARRELGPRVDELAGRISEVILGRSP